LGWVRVLALSIRELLTNRRTKKKNIYVISTPMRPVPLEHFLWAGKDLHKIVDSKSKFLGDGSVTTTRVMNPTDVQVQSRWRLSKA